MLCLPDEVQAGRVEVGEVEEVEVGVGEAEAEAEAEVEDAEGGPRGAEQHCLLPSPGGQESRIRATAIIGGAVVEARAAPATSSM